MTKASYSPISQAAADAFNHCVDALVMKNLALPELTKNAQLTGEKFTGSQNVGVDPLIDPLQR